MFDMSQIDEDEFHVDLGFMYGLPSKASDVLEEPHVGYTTLPRRCCLKDLVRRFNELIPDPEVAAKIKGNYYTWGLTKDIASVTIEFPSGHPFREFGLSYIQVYPSHKNLLECQGHYPFPLDDDSGICLALDSHGLKSLYSVVGRPVPDLGVCRASFRSSGARIGVSLLSHSHRSLHTRIELRVTETLRGKVRAEVELRRRRRQAQPVEVIPPEAGCPFYIHMTEVINGFMLASTQVPARLFQEVVSLAAEGHLGIDHQKFGVQTFQYLKVLHVAVLLQQLPYLNKAAVPVRPTPREIEEGLDEPRDEMGIGTEETIDTYGYGYPKHGRFNYAELNFITPLIAEQFPHPSHALSNIKARPDDRRRLNNLFQEIDFVIGRLRMNEDRDAQKVLLAWLVIRLLKQFLMDVTIYMIEGPYEFVNKERFARNIRDEANDGDREGRSPTPNGPRRSPIPPAIANNRPRSGHRRRARGTEEIATDHEWQYPEPEVQHSLGYSNLTGVIDRRHSASVRTTTAYEATAKPTQTC